VSSLTWELADSKSPISVFFQKSLANTKGILDTAVTHPAGFSTRAPASKPSPKLEIASMLDSFVSTGAPPGVRLLVGSSLRTLSTSSTFRPGAPLSKNAVRPICGVRRYSWKQKRTSCCSS
jgi:hypothetical protein